MPGAVLDRLESQLDFSIQYAGQTGSRGLGFGPSKISRHSSHQERRHELSSLCKKEDTDARILSLQDLARSGDFLKWDNLMNTQSDWNTQILQMSGKELAFTLNGQALTLPSPSNLRRWGFNHGACCLLCGLHSASASHILAGCMVGLKQGRYLYRHNNILRSILRDLRGIIAAANRRLPCNAIIPPIANSFIAAGKKENPKSVSHAPSKSLLHLADDWQLTIDLDGSFCWPIAEHAEIIRPDIMITSASRRIVIWGELTSPMERRMSISALIKTKRYMELKIALSVKGWTVYDRTFEVGALGFVSTTTRGFLSKLGFPASHAKYMVQRMCLIARRSSFYIWNARQSLSWKPPTLCDVTAHPEPVPDKASPSGAAAASTLLADPAVRTVSARTGPSAVVPPSVAPPTPALRHSLPVTPIASSAETSRRLPPSSSYVLQSCTVSGPCIVPPKSLLRSQPLAVINESPNASPAEKERPRRERHPVGPHIVTTLPSLGCFARGYYDDPGFNSHAHLFSAWVAPLPPHDYVKGNPFGDIRQKVWRRKTLEDKPGFFPNFIIRVRLAVPECR